jgi:hypothetical protein
MTKEQCSWEQTKMHTGAGSGFPGTLINSAGKRHRDGILPPTMGFLLPGQLELLQAVRPVLW